MRLNDLDVNDIMNRNANTANEELLTKKKQSKISESIQRSDVLVELDSKTSSAIALKLPNNDGCYIEVANGTSQNTWSFNTFKC